MEVFIMDIERVPTGIPGLDDLIEGGFPRDSITLVAGSSGTGKTTLTIQYLYNGVVKFNEPGMYIGLGENIERIKNSALRYGMDLEKLADKDDSLVFADIPALEIGDIISLIDSIKPKFKRLVIDPISALSFKYDANLNIRQNIRDLVEAVRDKNITAFITTEVLENSNTISRFGEEFLADNVLVLYYFREGARRFRGLEVRKARMTNHSELIHLYKISSEETEESGEPSGVKVYPNEKVFQD